MEIDAGIKKKISEPPRRNRQVKRLKECIASMRCTLKIEMICDKRKSAVDFWKETYELPVTCSTNSSRLTMLCGGRTVPGESTAFAPILDRSPTNAPNFSRPVLIRFAWNSTSTSLDVRSLKQLAMTAPASRLTPEPIRESPTKLKWANAEVENTRLDFISQPWPRLTPLPR